MFGQERREGFVTYVTSQHVYVKFASMENFSEGDTLYIRQDDKDIPALQILNLSSTSCVCAPIQPGTLKVSDKVYSNVNIDLISESVKDPTTTVPGKIPETRESDSAPKDSAQKERLKQEISGRLSVSSYSNFSNETAARSQRMRYTFSMHANNLGNSKLSAETYISFAHSNTELGRG